MKVVDDKSEMLREDRQTVIQRWRDGVALTDSKEKMDIWLERQR